MVLPWNHVSDSNTILAKKFDEDVFHFLRLPNNQRILYWLDDSYSLVQHCRTALSSLGGKVDYYDYSFMVTPAFKALELWIIALAPILRVNNSLIQNAKDYGNFRNFLGDDKIQPLVDAVIETLEERSKSKYEKAMRSSLNALSSYLSNLRHEPAHCGSIIAKPEQAETHFNEIVGAMNRITSLLIEAKVIKLPQPR